MSAWRTDKPTWKDGIIIAKVSGKSKIATMIGEMDGLLFVYYRSNSLEHVVDYEKIKKWCPLSEVERLIDES